MRFVQLKYIGQHLKEERPKPTTQLQIKKAFLINIPFFFLSFHDFYRPELFFILKCLFFSP